MKNSSIFKIFTIVSNILGKQKVLKKIPSQLNFTRYSYKKWTLDRTNNFGQSCFVAILWWQFYSHHSEFKDLYGTILIPLVDPSHSNFKHCNIYWNILKIKYFLSYLRSIAVRKWQYCSYFMDYLSKNCSIYYLIQGTNLIHSHIITIEHKFDVDINHC